MNCREKHYEQPKISELATSGHQTHLVPCRLFILAAISVLALSPCARADDVITNIMSPVVSYLYHDANTNIMSAPMSYLFFDTLPDSNLTFHASQPVSYFYQFGNGAALYAMQGLVKDIAGAGIAGATVAASVNQAVVAQTTTGIDGQYALPALAEGVYVLKATELTYESSARALMLNAGTARQDFQLAPLSADPDVLQALREIPPSFTAPPDGAMGSALRIFDGSSFVPISGGNVPSASAMTIILTHGWVPQSPDPSVLGTPFELWPLEMAAKIRASGVTPSLANILAWDWRYAAQDANTVPSYAVQRVGDQGRFMGEALVATLGVSYSKNLHFIGHSLGALVNSAAMNFIHGDRSGNARQPTSSAPWSSARTHVTVFDHASIAQLLKASTLEAGFNPYILEVINQSAPPPPWESPLPKRFGWADNYNAIVSMKTLPEAVNAKLQKAPSSLEAKHRYPIEWYNLSIDDPINGSNPLGFSQSYEFAMSIGLPASVFPPTTFAPGTLFRQSSDSDPLALALAFTPQQTTTIIAETVVRGVNATIEVIGNVEAAIVQEAQATGQSIAQGFDSAVNMVQQGLQSVVNIYNSGVLSITLLTGASSSGQQVQRAGYHTMDSGSSTNTSAMAWIPIDVPPYAVALAFDFMLSGDPVDDVIVCGINDSNLFSLVASDVPTNSVSSSRFLDVTDWQNQQVELFFGLMGGSSSGATLRVDNIRFYSMQLPALNISQDDGATALFWPSTFGGVMVEGAPSIVSTNWELITNAPVLLPESYSVSNVWSDPVRFFRLRSQ